MGDRSGEMRVRRGKMEADTGDIHCGLLSLSAPIPVVSVSGRIISTVWKGAKPRKFGQDGRYIDDYCRYPAWVQTARVCDNAEHRRLIASVSPQASACLSAGNSVPNTLYQEAAWSYSPPDRALAR
ncbi:MAG TPA: hypothetical protein VHV83_04815, partial [Armatimonadota bacterium]|nr:hypothetical protein [Armatimonadota bacterium]